MTTVAQTPFGQFLGRNKSGVVQYLGIKYATVKNQLAAPEVVKGTYGNQVVDCTSFGPRAPAMDGCQYEQSVLIQQTLDTPTAPPMSGSDCLNLNITVPDIKKDRPLPVMVFIHGGGYLMGANWWPQYDPTRLVRLSMENGMPVIAINFNYRLGVLGNLTSKELRKAGYPGNNSLRDQRCAFQWIKAHINAFGGDPDNVIAFGESAGAASVLSKLFSKEPLFKRAISMSGTPIMLKPLPVPVTEMSYDMIMKELGLENAPVEERIQRLLTISPDELVTRTPLTVPLIPFVDGDIVPTMMSFKHLEHDSLNVPGRQWCSELMIGDCQHDGNVFAYMGLEQRKTGIAAAFCTSLTKNLSSSTAAEAVLQAYDITPTTGDNSAFRKIIDYATDIAYYAPALVFAQTWPGKRYYYQFNEPNPFPGQFEGLSTHMLDATFLFQNYKEKFSPKTQDVAVSLAKEFIKFANGMVPWQEYTNQQGSVRIFRSGTSSKDGTFRDNGWGRGRRNTLFEFKEQGKVDLDELSVAWDLFIAGQ